MAELFYLPFPTAFSANGIPVPGAKATFYATGTSTKLPIYSDAALATERENPVSADSTGRFPDTYLDDTQVYRVVVTDRNGGSLGIDVDPYFPGATSSTDMMFVADFDDAQARTSEHKMRDIVSADDFPSHIAADTSGATSLFVPGDIVSTRATGAAVVANHWGPGQIETANGNKRGKWFSNVTAAPASVGDHDSIETAFNGDLSHSIFQVEHRITGASTLGTPATGYLYTPEAYPFYGVLYNSSGHNEETGGNDGRTGAAFMRVGIKQYGQGDLACYNASAFVTGTKVGSTSFLANPAAVLFNGDMTAGEDGVYLNSLEFILRDNGYDVAGLGPVINMVRTDATGAKGAWWGAFRAQNQGTVAPDNVLSAAGEWNTGLDFSMTDFGANEAAIALAPGQRFYGNAASSNGNYTTSFGDDWFEFTSGLGGWNFVVNGGSVLQVTASQVTANGVPLLAQNLRADGATPTVGVGQIGFGTTTTTSATAGASGAVPAQVLGYLVANLGGTTIKLPYYAA